jgi:release factor glutamine methyltransferase
MYKNIVQIFDAFKKNGLENPLTETLYLLDIYLKGSINKTDTALKVPEILRLDEIIRRRKAGEPIQYILGFTHFMGLEFFCSPDALIPREETELLAKTSLKLIKEKQMAKKKLMVIDMGTGCGNLAVSIALNSANTKVLASDISEEALKIARKNVEKYSLTKRISLFCGDLFESIDAEEHKGKIDLVVCNPPYIPTSSLAKLSSEIIEFEPKTALDAGSFGIDIFRRLIKDSVLYLNSGGILVFEIGKGQEKLVTRLLEKNRDYENIQYYDDGENIRVISVVKI